MTQVMTIPTLPGANAVAGTPQTPVPLDHLPPRVLLTWAATNSGAKFGGYNLYRRPRALPVIPWSLVGQILPFGPAATSSAPGAYASNSTVEAQHTSFLDTEVGWGVAGTRWAQGWDYDIRVVDLGSGVESPIGAQESLDDVVPASQNAWLTCNTAQWLCAPVHVLTGNQDAASQSADMTSRSSMFGNVLSYDVNGRDGGLTRTRLGTPPRTMELSFSLLGDFASDIFDTLKSASTSGRQLCLLESRGDRHWGSLVWPDVNIPNSYRIDAKAKFHVVAPIPTPANYNLPCRIVFNGSTQYAITTATLNPGANPWAMMVAGVFNNHAGDVYLSDGSVAANTLGSFGFYCPSTGTFRSRVHGAAGSLDLSSTANWFDGNPHVAILSFDGTTYTLWIDGVVAASAAGSGVGSITNTANLVAAADNGGASGFSASGLQAWGVWLNTTLTPLQALTIARYLLGYWGYRLPAGASAFYNAADLRCWNGYSTSLADLAGASGVASLVASPTTKGIPGSLADLDKQW